MPKKDAKKASIFLLDLKINQILLKLHLHLNLNLPSDFINIV